MLIYIAGAMKNREGIRQVILRLEKEGFKTFYDWIMPGEETDSKWKEFEESLGHTFLQAIQSPHAKDVFEFDKEWLDKSDAFILVYPAGKSGHIELGYMAGKEKTTYVLLDEIPTRWDVMLQFAGMISYNLEDIVADLLEKNFERVLLKMAERKK